MKISELINQLEAIEAECGDIEIAVSSDQEGNNYRILNSMSIRAFGDNTVQWELEPYELYDEDNEVIEEPTEAGPGLFLAAVMY